METTRRDHSSRSLVNAFKTVRRWYHQRLHAKITLIACLHHLCVGFILRANPARGESHIQRNVNREVATKSISHNPMHRQSYSLQPASNHYG